MKLILILAAFFAAAYFMAINTNAPLRWVGQSLLIFINLCIFGAILFCIFFPVVRPETESGVLILIVVPLILTAIIPWFLLKLAKEVVINRQRTPEEREKIAKENFDNITEGINQQLEDDIRNVGKFWISPTKRRQLRENMKRNRFMLESLKKIEDASRKKKEDRDSDPLSSQ